MGPVRADIVSLAEWRAGKARPLPAVAQRGAGLPAAWSRAAEDAPDGCSLFSAAETVFTRRGAAPVACLRAGTEILTRRGFRPLTGLSCHRAREGAAIDLPPGPSTRGRCYAGDSARYLFLHGEEVEAALGHPACGLLPFQALRPFFAAPMPEGADARRYALHFDWPEIVICETGEFASSIADGNWRLFSPGEAARIFSRLIPDGAGADA